MKILLVFLATVLPIATASAAPKNAQINVQQLNTDGYDYITIADDGTAYFGKITKRVSDIALLELVVIDDPRNNKTAYKTREAYNCKKNTFQNKNMKWETFKPGTVGLSLIKYACS